MFGEDGAGSSGGRGGGDLFELIFRQKGQKGLGGFYEGPSRLNRGRVCDGKKAGRFTTCSNNNWH